MLIEPKKIEYTNGTCLVQSLRFIFPSGTDPRVLRQTKELFGTASASEGETSVSVSYTNHHCDDCSFHPYQGYTIIVLPESISIKGDSAQGAFYGLETLYELISDRNELPCMVLVDTPDLLHRSFYLDVSRGRIPSVKTIKKLIDRLAICRINSLQLYIEHTFAFRELGELNARYGCYTAEDIREIVRYCKEHFIDCIPSLSTFGHMYYILQSPPFRHLCELEHYKPKEHIWRERLMHHTIDYANPESFSLIQSFIDQYAALFDSSYFNICCDETFDLVKGKNQGKDPTQAYISFVKKIIAYLQEKGLTPMMWGDILWKSPQSIHELPSQTILLNWNYDRDITDESIRYYYEHNANQIVCPGVSSWGRLCECPVNAVDNILKTVDFAYQYNAKGILNTCWGDFGHTAPIDNCLFGMALGGAKSWNVTGFDLKRFSLAISKRLYGYEGDILEILQKIEPLFSVWRGTFEWLQKKKGLPFTDVSLTVENFTQAKKDIWEGYAILREVQMDPEIQQNLLLAAKLNRLLSEMVSDYLCHRSIESETMAELSEAYTQYRHIWLCANKKDELFVLDSYIEELKQNLCSVEVQ